MTGILIQRPALQPLLNTTGILMHAGSLVVNSWRNKDTTVFALLIPTCPTKEQVI